MVLKWVITKGQIPNFKTAVHRKQQCKQNTQSKIESYDQQSYSKHRTTINHGFLNLRLQTSDLLL